MGYGYMVEIKQSCIEDYHDGQPYGEWGSEYSNSFGGIRQATKDDKYPTIFAPFEAKRGEDVFVVWYEYSTGDSFGHSTRGSTDVAGVFKDLESAKSLKKAIENHKEEEGSFSFEHTTPDGQKIELCASWTGYFEHLENVHIECVEVS